MAITKPGTFGAGDTTSVSTRNTSVLPTVVVGDVLFCMVMGTSSTTVMAVSAPGVTFVQQDKQTVSGLGATLFRGIVTNAAASPTGATGAVVTVTTFQADGTTALLTRVSVSGIVLRGIDNTGTSGANAVNAILGSVSGTGSSTYVTPNTPSTTVANTILLSMVGYAGSTTLYLDMTYEGGTPDRKSFTAGTAVSISSTGMHADLTTIAAASTPGAKTFINYSNTPPTTTAAGSRVGWSIAVAPAATAPTVSATISASDPVVGTALSLNGTITGTATSQGWSQISGPTSPTISGSTTVTGTVTPTVAGTYVFQFDASNTAGAATPAQVTAYVHPASGDPTPVVAVTLGVFTALAGTTAAANLNDANDTTGIQNTGTPVHTDKATITYAPLGLGGITFPLRGRWTSSALTMRGIAYKADGTTQLFTADFTLTNTVATYNLVLDSTALAAIPALSDRRALIVKVSAA